MTLAVKRVFETLDNLSGPLARLRRSLANPAGTFLIRDTATAEAAVDEIDQFLQRFQQVADIALRKLVPRLVTVVTGGQPPPFFRDVLDVLERAQVIEEAAWWVDLNDRRNRLVHEYAMQPEVRRSELNAAWAAATGLVDRIGRIQILAEKLW